MRMVVSAAVAAPLGDDVLGDEPTVQALEAKVAALLGKEAALYVPSGTMANQLAIRSVCEPGDEIIAHRDSHIIHYETGGPAALSGCMVRGIDGVCGIHDASAVAEAIRHKVHGPGLIYFTCLHKRFFNSCRDTSYCFSSQV